MKKQSAPPSGSACPACGASKIIRRMPKETGREVTHHQIPHPHEPGKIHKVAVLRIAYRRDFFCPDCGYQWFETHVTEKQEGV